MSSLPQSLHVAFLTIGAGGFLYGATVFSVGLTSVLARNRELRQDARETLKILLRQARRDRSRSRQ